MLLPLLLTKRRETHWSNVMNWKGLFLRIVWLWLILAPLCGLAQIRGGAAAMAGVDVFGNPQTVEAALHLMADQAAIIFVGTVAEVIRPAAANGVVEIRFTVEQAIRGCSAGLYTVREWDGLWNPNASRYHVGQRLLLFLHAPGAAGLSSPVGGLDGAIPIRASGTGVSAGNATTASADSVADLRWVGARLARTVVYRPSKAPVPSSSRAMAAGAPTALAAPPAPSVSDSSKPAQEASISSVVNMIRSWEVSANATR